MDETFALKYSSGDTRYGGITMAMSRDSLKLGDRYMELHVLMYCPLLYVFIFP